MKKGHSLDAKSFNKMLYIFLGIVLLLTLSFSVFLIIFLNNLSIEISKNKFISINNNKKIEALSKLQNDYKSMSKESDKLDEYLPDKKEVSSILRDLEAMAAKDGLTFGSYQVGGSTVVQTKGTSKIKSDDVQIQNLGDYSVFSFQMVLTGSYANVDAMIKDIENYSRLTEVKDVKYNKNTTVAGGDAIEATLQVNAYLKK